MTTQTIHRLSSKAALARHLCYSHMAILMDPKEVATWSKEELDAVHARLHKQTKEEE